MNKYHLKKILIVTLVLTNTISFCQDLKYVPDENLRAFFEARGFLTKDSLDLRKIKGRLILEIKNKNISNLNGLQYFTKVWLLDISNNKISSLEYLPPNLKELYCSNNLISDLSNLPSKIGKLSVSKNRILKIPRGLPRSLKYLKIRENRINEIGELPINLEFLDCSNNEIEIITDLPPNLKHLRISNNLVEKIPCSFYQQLKFLNYYNNPIESITCIDVSNYSCSDYSQNCIPGQQLKQPILGNEVLSIPSLVYKIDMTIESNYSWGGGDSMEKISYVVGLPLPHNELYLSGIKVEKKAGFNRKELEVSSSNYRQNILIDTVTNALRDMKENTNLIELINADTIISFDFSEINHRSSVGMISCIDCNSHRITIELTGKKDEKTKLEYQFYNSDHISFWIGDDLRNITRAKDWLYIYRLVKIMLDESHWLRKSVFSLEKAKLLHKSIFGD